MSKTIRRTVSGVALMAVAALTACGSSSPSAPAGAAAAADVVQNVTQAQLVAGQAVPAPRGPVVLTISGLIGTHNRGKTLVFDMATLERLGLVEYRVDDRQALGREVLFRGVLVSKLLAVAGVSKDARVMHTYALNDYKVDVPVSDASQFPLLLATSADGVRMPVDKYGPLRFVYPYDRYHLDPTVYDPRWIWQLKSIVIA